MQNLEPLKPLLGYGADTPDARLKEAMTHRSYAVENQIAYDNQRLEFLGDAVLEIALSVHLFQKYPRADEGKLTRMRSVLVRESALAELARHLHLGDYLLVGKGEKEVHGTCRISTLADLFEAVIGAAYLEVGSQETLAMLVKLFDGILPAPDRLIDEVNPKGSLQEFAQMVCNACDLNLRPGYFTNGEWPVQRFSASKVTGRQLMQWVGRRPAGFVRLPLMEKFSWIGTRKRSFLLVDKIIFSWILCPAQTI